MLVKTLENQNNLWLTVVGLFDVALCIDNHLSQNIQAMNATSPGEWLYIFTWI